MIHIQVIIAEYDYKNVEFNNNAFFQIAIRHLANFVFIPRHLQTTT